MINTTKTKYVKIDGWRGYLEPINAIAGCNYTGMTEDSPCPSDVAEAEINSFLQEVRRIARRIILNLLDGIFAKVIINFLHRIYYMILFTSKIWTSFFNECFNSLIKIFCF